MNSDALNSILDRLEALEDPLLCWGVVDGGLSTDELRTEIDTHLALIHEWEVTSDDVIEALIARSLLVHDTSVTPGRWRTRNGETLRLLSRLRQVFLNQPWANGTALVSDFRYARRPRSYPRRDQPWDTALDGITGVDERQQRVIDVMTRRNGEHDILAGFQIRATRQILTSLQGQSTTATVVGAGTGSGKTNAFYLPAFSHLASIDDASAWTRALAVYPRIELLKDQLDTAFAHARRLDEVWQSQVGRPLTIGALYGSTPNSPRNVRANYRGWIRRSNGMASPQMRCPGDGFLVCGGELIWPDSDIDSGRERLTCSSCSRSFDDTQIVLTRNRMKSHPPDILFVTTEMLNRGLSDLSLRRTLGIDVPLAKKPRMILLDEIHTYEGAPGAQAALVLRRWHHSIQAPITFVGLSATLSDPVGHMSNLTGVPKNQVTSITPEPAELEHEGAEYLLALRSDPTSGASVLSTTIQTSMLLCRTQDHPRSRVSDGTYGTKGFAFTDDLDVTNRLFSYLLDAEGQRYFKGRTESTKPPLASTRTLASGGDAVSQRRAGQLWDLPMAIGHQFAKRGEGLRVSRTTSQDAGVSSESQLIVATASLEVGFDDADVGVVLQHKAPRGVAAFLQRKGRAGRKRTMRPYTVVVLSDYGRDRVTYEAWDTLFEPVLPELVLPIRNRAVLRMQATVAAIDWLADQLRALGVPHTTAAWGALSKKPAASFARPGRETQLKAVEVLKSTLRDPVRQGSLTSWVRDALGLTEAEVNEILWHPPRPLLLSAIPTLMRRLEYNWAVAHERAVAEFQDVQGDNPLPDFFPSNLFSELALPEAHVSTPPQSPASTERDLHPMVLGQLLREYAPGRVSRRFATQNLEHRHWIPVPLGKGHATVELNAILPVYSVEAPCLIELDGEPTEVTVVRPDRVLVEIPPDDVKDSSNATLMWRSQFDETGSGLAIRVPVADPMGRLIADARFFLHAQNAHVNVHRAAIKSDAAITMSDGSEERVRVQFALDGAPVALGSTYDVDGLRVRVTLPANLPDISGILPGLRSAWFKHVLLSDPDLLESLNSFRIDWLHQCLEAMLITRAVKDDCTIEEAFAAVASSFASQLDETLDSMFRMPGVLEQESAELTRLGARLKAALADPVVSSRLDALAPQYWNPDPELFEQWLRERCLSTIGHAMLAAARQICPEHDPEGVVVDLEPGLDGDSNRRTGEVWLTETTIGGGGFIEALATRVRPDPRRFLRLTLRAVQPSNDELVDSHLRRVIELIECDPSWATLVNAFRGATNQADRIAALNELRERLRRAGIYGAEQSVVSALSSRVLRPGSTSATEAALRIVLHEWETAEDNLRVEIAPRTWSYLMRNRTDLDTGLVLASGTGTRQRTDAIQSLLWPRGWQLRAAELSAWNPFADNLPPSPELLRALTEAARAPIPIGDDVATSVRSVLASHGSAQILATTDQAEQLAHLLVDLSTDPVVTEYLSVYPRVVEIDHLANGDIIVSLELAEVSG